MNGDKYKTWENIHKLLTLVTKLSPIILHDTKEIINKSQSTSLSTLVYMSHLLMYTLEIL